MESFVLINWVDEGKTVTRFFFKKLSNLWKKYIKLKQSFVPYCQGSLNIKIKLTLLQQLVGRTLKLDGIGSKIDLAKEVNLGVTVNVLAGSG